MAAEEEAGVSTGAGPVCTGGEGGEGGDRTQDIHVPRFSINYGSNMLIEVGHAAWCPAVCASLLCDFLGDTCFLVIVIVFFGGEALLWVCVPAVWFGDIWVLVRVSSCVRGVGRS